VADNKIAELFTAHSFDDFWVNSEIHRFHKTMLYINLSLEAGQDDIVSRLVFG
jgi:hypothetical protein